MLTGQAKFRKYFSVLHARDAALWNRITKNKRRNALAKASRKRNRP